MGRRADAEALAELHTILSHTEETGELGPLEDLHRRGTGRPGIGPSAGLRIECELEAQRSRRREVATSARVWEGLADRCQEAGLETTDPTFMSIRSYHAQYVRRRGWPGDEARGVAMYEEEYRLRSEALGPDDPRTATDAEPQTAEEAEAAPDAESHADEKVEEPETSEEAAVDTGADLTAEHLIDPEDAERFHSGWNEVKAAFVDGPSDAVQQASALVGGAVDEVTTALTRLRQNLDRQSQDTDPADTERLRQVLRGYGSLLTHILTR